MRIRRRGALRRAVPAVLAALLYTGLLCALFAVAGEASLSSSAFSLRYNQPLSPAQVASAKHHWGNPELSPDFYAAYWREMPAQYIATDRGSAFAPVLYVDGDMAAVLPVSFVQGGYPSALEDRGLALSQALAWELFGSTGVTGSTLNWNGHDYTIRGVFAGEGMQVLAQINASNNDVDGFTGVELCGSPGGDAGQAAETYRMQAGLPEADLTLNAKTLPAIIWLLAWLPAALLALWLLGRLLLLLHRAMFWKRQLTWLVVLLLAAFFLPQFLADLPPWIIPKQWSDFDHWGTFINDLNAYITGWMSLAPGLRDVQLRRQLILQVLLAVPALFALFFTIRRWGARMRRKDIDQRMAQDYRNGLDPVPYPEENTGNPRADDAFDDYDDLLILKK